MKTTPNIINWLSNKAGDLSAPDSYGDRTKHMNCGWKDIRGLHTQLQSLSKSGTGLYTSCKKGGAAPDAKYRFQDSEGVMHMLEIFATGRVNYTAGLYSE